MFKQNFYDKQSFKKTTFFKVFLEYPKEFFFFLKIRIRMILNGIK